MVPSMPKVVDIEERRSELAAAAAQLIARSGVGAATLREVAAEAGWTTGALTHYFADKRALLRYTFASSLAGRHAAHTVAGSPRQLLVESLEGALPLDDDRRRHWMVTIALCAQAVGDDELSTVQRDAYRDFRARIAGLAGACTGRSDTADAAEAGALAERLIAVADGISIQALFDLEGWPPERQRARLHELIEPLLAPVTAPA
jgi:AcrR family transcriptional regulator